MKTYLRLMAARKAVKVRASLNQPIYSNMDRYLENLDYTTEERVGHKLLLPRLDECLSMLTPKAQQVLKLRYHGEMTNENIGNLLGGSKQYIGRLISQCLRKLKKCLQKKPRNPAEEGQETGGTL
jgi:RNA polymerase sigma factor (sigma-70 family)